VKGFAIILAGTLLLIGCQNYLVSTWQPGIRFGMSKLTVIDRISRTDQIISTNGDTVVTEGIYGAGPRHARKEFKFEDDQLHIMNYKIVD
jgi:hypothetical protein